MDGLLAAPERGQKAGGARFSLVAHGLSEREARRKAATDVENATPKQISGYRGMACSGTDTNQFFCQKSPCGR